MEIIKITEEATDIRNALQKDKNDEANPIDLSLPIIPPFIGKGKIELIIIGQDPTVRNVKSREKIKCTLNLDKSNSLQRYILDICKRLDCTLDNIYATNVFKYFYTKPPADTFDVLLEHLEENLALLKEEVNNFPEAKIITLGEPALKLLCGKDKKVRNFWGYKEYNNGKFTHSADNKLDRAIFVLPHIRSILSKKFYKNNLDQYLEYIKLHSNLRKSYKSVSSAC